MMANIRWIMATAFKYVSIVILFAILYAMFGGNLMGYLFALGVTLFWAALLDCTQDPPPWTKEGKAWRKQWPGVYPTS